MVKNEKKSNKNNNYKKRLIIIGGGFAGAIIAKELENNFNTTLIDTKTYFEFTPSILRVLVKPKYIKHVQVLHTHYLHKAKFIKGKVTKFTKKTITVNKKTLNFDYLVIATGSAYARPIKGDIPILNRATELRKYFLKLKSAKTVLIIGGGYTGVELAAEIADKFEDEIKQNKKKIILVHPKSRLIHKLPLRASKYAKEFLEDNKIKIMLNNRIDKISPKTCTTIKKEKICADLVFLCTGIIPNTKLIENSMPHKLDDNNQIKTSSFLQLYGEKNIFVAGDVSNMDKLKTAQNAELQAKTIIKNIENLSENKNLIEYKSKINPMVISLGNYDGIFIYKNFTLTGFMPGLLKSIIECLFMRKLR